MFAVGGGEGSATTGKRLVANCLPTPRQVLFGLILDDAQTGSCVWAVLCAAGVPDCWPRRTLTRLTVGVPANSLPRGFQHGLSFVRLL